MLIKRVHIENFKRFKNLKITLQPLDCLVGANNSGKSTLIQALALFDFVIHNCLSRKSANGNGSKNPIEIKNRSIAPDEFIVLPVANAIDLWTDKIPQKSGKHILIGVEIEFENEKTAKANVDLNFNRFSISLQTEDNQQWLEELANFKISYLPVFSSFLTQEERRTPAVIEDALARGRVNSVIRNLLYDLNETAKVPQLEKILQNAIPNLKNLKVKFDEITDRYIEVSYAEEGKNKQFDLSMSGSGFQQFVYLFGFILLRNPNVILLDEPDVHLHGTLQGALLEEIKRLVQEQNKQVVFATHSKDLITRLEPDNIISLNDGEAKRLKVNFDIYDTLELLGSIDNIQIAQIQNFKRLLVVEDVSDWRFLQIFGKKILDEATWQKVEKRLAIFPANGNPYKQDMPRLKKQLTSMFSLTGQPLKLYVLSDWDYYPDPKSLLDEKNKLDPDIQFYIWQRSEIENYLLVPDSISRLVESKTPGKNLFQAGLEAEFYKLVEDSRDKVEEQFISGIEYYRKIKNNGWDGVTINRKMKEIMNNRWANEKIILTDAKECVLPGLKRWLQNSGFKQFSDHSLAESLQKEELAEEVHNVIKQIAEFAGVSVEKN